MRWGPRAGAEHGDGADTGPLRAPDVVIYADDEDGGGSPPEGPGPAPRGPGPAPQGLGPAPQGSDPAPRGSGPAPRTPSARWAAPVVVAVLAFGFGLAVGTHADGGTTAGTPTAATTLPVAGPSAPAPESTRATSGGDSAARTADSAPGPSSAEEQTSPSTTQTTGEPMAMATDMCGVQTPVGRIDGAAPLPGATGTELVAGPKARVVDSASSSKPMPLLRPDGDGPPEYVSEIVPDGDRLLATVQTCGREGSARFVEITSGPGGFAIDPIAAPVPDGFSVANLVIGGKIPWAALYRSAAGARAAAGGDSETDSLGEESSALLALDGSGKVVRLPAGFGPVAASHGRVVGLMRPIARSPSKAGSGGILQIFDLSAGGIVDQLGTYVGQYAAGDGYILWQPQCTGQCETHRLDIASGKDTVVGPAPDVPRPMFTNWLTVSPDGTKIAMAVPRGEVTQLADGSYEISGDPGFAVAVLDVETGHTSIAAGIQIPWPFVSARFSSDSRWLFVGMATRTGGAVVAFDHAAAGPFAVATLPDFSGLSVPLAALAG